MDAAADDEHVVRGLTPGHRSRGAASRNLSIVAARDCHGTPARSTAARPRLLERSHPRSRYQQRTRPGRGSSSPISISITSRSCITCRGWWTSTPIAARRCSTSAAAPAPTSRGSRKGARSSSGVDLSSSAIALARQNFAQQGLTADLREADGEHLPFDDDAFDFVFAHGVVQYTADDAALVDECRRVLKPGGTAVFQVYNRVSWLNGLSKVMKVPLEHEDAPVLKRYSAGEFRALLTGFTDVRIVEERFPGEVAAARRLEGARRSTRSSSAPSTRCRAPGCAGSAGTCWRSARK